jgi:hypothetical protein
MFGWTMSEISKPEESFLMDWGSREEVSLNNFQGANIRVPFCTREIPLLYLAYCPISLITTGIMTHLLLG